MGLKSWIRKILIDEEKPTLPPNQPPVVFQVDETRHNAVMAILQGRPFFVIYATPKGIVTYTTGLLPEQIRVALEDMAAKVPEMKDILTNVAIDINTATNAKQNESR